MTLDATLPSDSATVLSSLYSLMRETRALVNSLETQLASAGITTAISQHTMESGETEIDLADLNDVPSEFVELTGTVAVNLEHITGCRAGQIKIIRFMDSNVTVKYDATKIALETYGATEDFSASAGDMLTLINRNGDPDTTTDGLWEEVSRKAT
jgi:hypothetical protein